MSHYGICGVIDLMTNQRLWSKHLPWPPAGPQFSPDGKLLVTSSPDGVQCVHVLSSATGLVVAELTGMKQAVAGIEITSSGTVYAWDFFGTITAWDLASRRLLHKSSIECTRADRGSL
jgi:WD40 repeat protein